MIRVAKPKNGVPAELAQAGAEERREAAKYYRAHPSPSAAYKFSAYKLRCVRDTLNQMFHYKCAYCESTYGATQPVAIEHYRPKSMVADGTTLIVPGYWWLAADWSNLLPSCTDCNSVRKHVFNGILLNRGKGNQFPLENPTRRARRPGQEKRERPLLLNPCCSRTDPLKHVEFILDGKLRPILREKSLAQRTSRKGRVSILVYGLDRPRLVLERQAVAKRIIAQIKSTRNAYKISRSMPGNAFAREHAQSCSDELRNFLSPEAPYLGMCRQILQKEFPGLLRKQC